MLGRLVLPRMVAAYATINDEGPKGSKHDETWMEDARMDVHGSCRLRWGIQGRLAIGF